MQHSVVVGIRNVTNLSGRNLSKTLTVEKIIEEGKGNKSMGHEKIAFQFIKPLQCENMMGSLRVRQVSASVVRIEHIKKQN